MTAMLPKMDFQTRILIVDDDEGIRSLMATFLAQHGFVAETAADVPAMRETLAAGGIDLIVLDLMMPGEDGLSALRDLQARGGPPVIMLSAMGTDVDRIVGLELGADDYLVKPCNPRELLARIRTVLRRQQRAARAEPDAAPGPTPTIRFDGWILDPMLRRLTDPDGSEVPLSDGEFRLLRAFTEHARRVLTRDQLLDFAHGQDTENFDRAVDVQVSRLRRKLAAGPGGEALIRTVRSEGYMFTAAVRAG